MGDVPQSEFVHDSDQLEPEHWRFPASQIQRIKTGLTKPETLGEEPARPRAGDWAIIGSSIFANLNLDPHSIRGSRNPRADASRG